MSGLASKRRCYLGESAPPELNGVVSVVFFRFAMWPPQFKDNLPEYVSKFWVNLKAAEALDIIANNRFAKCRPLIEMRVTEHDSKSKPIIQLCDLLLGAVIQSWSRSSSSGNKLKLQTHIASCLCWETPNHGTWAKQKKFNVWHLHDHGTNRRVLAKTVHLRWP